MKKLLFFLSVFPTLTMANDFYFLGGAGISHLKIWDYENFISKDQSALAHKLLIGYQLNSVFSTEFGYARLGKANFKHADGSSASLNNSAFFVNIKTNLPNLNEIKPYIKFGVSRLKNAERWSDATSFDNKTENNIYWSIGAEYPLGRNYFLALDYDSYGKSGAFNRNDWSTQPAGIKANAMTIGLRWLF
jgi:hypothetical protein